MTKPRIAVIVGSIRPNRFGDKPAQWIYEHAKARGDIEVELVDLKDYPLPLFDAPASDFWMPTPNEGAARWQKKLDNFDGYIFVTAEYNRSVPGALKNAIDWAYKPFIRKPAAFIGYGSVGGARAVEHLRNIMNELQVVPVRQAIHIGGSEFAALYTGKKSWDEVKGAFDPFVPDLLDNLVWWTNATRAARHADAAEREEEAAYTVGHFSWCLAGGVPMGAPTFHRVATGSHANGLSKLDQGCRQSRSVAETSKAS